MFTNHEFKECVLRCINMPPGNSTDLSVVDPDRLCPILAYVNLEADEVAQVRIGHDLCANAAIL